MSTALPRRILTPLMFSILALAVASPAFAQKVKTVQPPDVSVVPAPRKDDKGWINRQELINHRVKRMPQAQLIMIGDSITHGWEGKGKDVWKKYYANKYAYNLGIGGDQTQHVLWRLEHGNLDGIHPKLAVLMIGTNNAGSGQSPEQIVAGVEAIVKLLRKKVPQTKILILAIFPRGADEHNTLRQVNEAANREIAKFADGSHVFYLDIGPKFLSADGTLPKEIMPDRLHPNERGYEIWAEAIQPTIDKLTSESSP